jgi:glycosyltransferase involved in cell wall biosynthesis
VKDNIKVSIITVSYNSEKTIEKTIQSVLNQTYSNIEYIIVDGKSEDNTIILANQYTQKFIEKGYTYKIISEKDKGIYDAMNKGAKLASGSIVGMINSDDWYESNTVKIVTDQYEKTAFDIAYGNLNVIKNNKNFKKIAKKGMLTTTRNWNFPSMFVSKSTYEELDYFISDNIYADWDFYLRVIKNNKKVLRINEVLANFTTFGISHRKSIRDYKNRIRDRYKCYRRNGYSRLYFIESIFMETIKIIF